jgi:hypothetical protein
MSAKVYSGPDSITPPSFSYNGKFDHKAYDAEEERYVKELRAWLKDEGYAGEYVGGIIYFPIADGRASYMVASLRPLILIHMNWGDAWDADAILLRGLVAQDVKDLLRPSIFKDRFALEAV